MKCAYLTVRPVVGAMQNVHAMHADPIRLRRSHVCSGPQRMKRLRKTFAYITHGSRLLVFTHPDSPEAGIQVPAGTLRDGELPEEGVLREAREETGLEGLALGAYLGRQDRDMRDFGRDELHERYFYHVLCAGDPTETWQHGEIDPWDGGASIPFDFFWVPLSGEGVLTAWP